MCSPNSIHPTNARMPKTRIGMIPCQRKMRVGFFLLPPPASLRYPACTRSSRRYGLNQR
jgi:hypothetical protein